MLTDRPPANQGLLAEFRKSDRLSSLELPLEDRLIMLAKSVEDAMNTEQRTAVRLACADFLAAASDFYRVSQPSVRALAARPLTGHCVLPRRET